MNRFNVRLIAAFAAVYIIWGSTYLAIHFAIETIPPLLMAGVRFLIAGALTYGVLRARGAVAPTRANWKAAAVVGGLLLLGGNGALVWGEQVRTLRAGGAADRHRPALDGAAALARARPAPHRTGGRGAGAGAGGHRCPGGPQWPDDQQCLPAGDGPHLGRLARRGRRAPSTPGMPRYRPRPSWARPWKCWRAARCW